MDHYYTDFLQRGWEPNFNRHPPTSLLEMVIVEPRNHECLAGVLSNMSCLIPNAMLTIFHSQENEEMVKSIVKNSNNVRLIPTFVGNINRDAYSQLLCSPEFWKQLIAPKTLIFQTDTAMRYNGILRFMQYDYIGAPWIGPVLHENPHVRIGNGGFSLRTRALMEDIVQKYPMATPSSTDTLPEDVYFGNHIPTYNHANIPTVADAAWFSLEYIQHPNPMACHKAWTFQTHSEEYICSLMTTNLASIKSTTQLQILDAWVERENGGICRAYDITSWLCLGISTDGLFLPQGTVIDCIEKDPFPGYKKYLKLHMTVNENRRLYTVRLYHNRVLEDIHICK